MLDYKKIKKSLKKALKSIEQMEMLDELLRAQQTGQLPPHLSPRLLASEFASATQEFIQHLQLPMSAGDGSRPSLASGDSAPPPMGYEEWLRKLQMRQGGQPSAPIAPSASPAIQSAGQVDEAVRQSEARLRAIIDATPLGICITNQNYIFEYVNRAYAEIYGYEPHEMLGKPFTMIVERDKEPFWRDLHDKYLAGYKEIRGEWRTVHKSGKPLTILADAARIVGADGKPKKVTFVMDITELTRLREESRQNEVMLMQTEKMSSLGQMAAGLAHEMNTPLGFVRNNLELLEGKHKETKELLALYEKLRSQIMYGSPNDVAMLLSQIDSVAQRVKNRVWQESDNLFRSAIEGIDRIQDLVLSLKNFSRLDEAELKPTDINENIESTLKIASHLFKGGIQLVKEFSPLPMVQAYPAQLNQVFLNLITNAVHAVDEKTGRIVIKTMQHGNHVVIKVIDNGKGIPPENLKKIFDPFFTTKPVGEGTGLGLTIAYKIVERHGGKIDVQSQVGRGTEFTITLPVSGTATAVKQSATSPFADSPFAE
ncbi:MAG: ATP-binding protein [Chloroherpetonaceae bacterium]|nr:ATP-binding protein [Chloroherpetonaceae bacterium]MDW8438734.1 ATP-binding protein [Chloroherpetonaceae bacterium]